MTMTSAELIEYRSRLFHEAQDFIKPERTPNFGTFVTWKIIDYGAKFSDAFHDYDLMEKIVRAFCEKYPVDVLMDTGVRNTFRVNESFGPGYYYYDDVNEVVGVHSVELVPAEELMEYVADPTKYMWTKIMPMKYPDLASKTLEDWNRTWKEQQDYTNFMMHIGKVVSEDYGMPSLTSPSSGFITPFIETMFNSIRGIKGLSIDLRRNKALVKEACDAMDERSFIPAVNKILAGESGHDYKACFDVSILMLVHTIMNTKNFEEIYWPTLKKLIDAAEAKGKNMRITVEGAGERIFDFFKDYKKGTLSLLLEQDDIFETRKKMPNTCLVGGMLTTTLNDGTPQECVDLTKRLIDEVGANGGYIFATNKFVSYRNDANSDNVKAVCDFILDYRG